MQPTSIASGSIQGATRYRRRHRLAALLAMVLLLLSYACAKINVWDEPPDFPVIDSIAPAKGKIGTQIRLYGTGFSYHSSENAVRVNGVDVRVDSPSSSTIVLATITSITGTGHVHITVNNKDAEGPIFTYDENAVSINSLTPSAGWVDTLVTIHGVGFGTVPDSIKVFFNNTPAVIKQFADTLIKVTAPDALNQNPGTAQVTVVVGSKTSNSMPFVYQLRPVITNVTRNYWQPGNTTYYFISVDNLAGINAANKLFVNGNPVVIDSVFRNGSAEYNFTPVGEKVIAKTVNADQDSISLLDFVVSAYGITSSPYHFINDPLIQDIISLHNFPGGHKKTGPGDTLEITGRYFGTAQSSPLAELWDSTSPLVSPIHYLPDPTILTWSNTDIKIIIPTSYPVQPDSLTMVLKLKQNGKEADAYIRYIKQTQTTGSGDVYVLGTDAVNYYVWKNGVATYVPGCTNAKDMFVSGSDVYIAGETQSGNGAHYWKNGTSVDLRDAGTTSSNANAIYVSGSDVYVAGMANNAVVYWKNGVRVNLTDGTKQAYATGIVVSGSDVYVCGMEYNASISAYNVAYWKNGVRTNVGDVTKPAMTNFSSNLAVSGSDVYVSGAVYYGFTPPNIYNYGAVYWKNGSQVNVTDGSGIAYGNGIAVNGTDVYVNGQQYVFAATNYTKAYYWRNGIQTDLTGSADGNCNSSSIFVSGTDIYVSGGRHGGNTKGPEDGGYWKNSVYTALSSCSYAYKVMVQ